MEGQDALDRADMADLASGDDSALNKLMERHAEKLFHYLLRLLQNETEASDAAQEAFVKVYQSRSKFKQQSKFSTWLYAIATNLARDRLRWQIRHPQVSLHGSGDEEKAGLEDTLSENRPTPSEAIQMQEQAQLVQKAVAKLPEELRVPLVLFEYEQQSHAQIAEILHCSAKAVELRLYRARQKLREALSPILETT